MADQKTEPTGNAVEESLPTSGRGLIWGLSARLMVLTIAFLMLAEFLIWAPSVARYRLDYLQEHLAEAHLAMVAVDAMKSDSVDMDLEEQLLLYTGTHGIVLNLTDHRMLMVGETMPPRVDIDVDLSNSSLLSLQVDAFRTLAQPKNRVLRVLGVSPKDPGILVEVIIDEHLLRMAMINFSWRILGLSVVISLFTAVLVFLSLNWLMVRPIRRIIRNLGRFRDRPEDATRVIEVSRRTDEIGIAERELQGMQEEVRRSLGQKTRLAALGAAVARVTHDLRNTLATVALASERLSSIQDTKVQRVMPRLYQAIDRAVRLCSQTIDYVSASDLKLRKEPFHLAELMSEVDVALREIDLPAEHDGQDEKIEMSWQNRVPFEITVVGDRHQLFRAFSNLAQNARLEGATTFVVAASMMPDGKNVIIHLVDDGPGLPMKTQEQLFQPFAGSSRKGGTGLGLVIAYDIFQAHGGRIDLIETGPEGTDFCIELPAEEAPLILDDEE